VCVCVCVCGVTGKGCDALCEEQLQDWGGGGARVRGESPPRCRYTMGSIASLRAHSRPCCIRVCVCVCVCVCAWLLSAFGPQAARRDFLARRWGVPRAQCHGTHRQQLATIPHLVHVFEWKHDERHFFSIFKKKKKIEFLPWQVSKINTTTTTSLLVW
jgi:hypothetical protein